MKLAMEGHIVNKRKEIEATLVVIGDDGSHLLEDRVKLSIAKDRSRFAALVAKQLQVPEDRTETQLSVILKQARVIVRAGSSPEARKNYEVVDGRLCWLREGLAVPLANFTASINHEIIRDNGLEEQRVFSISGTLASGKALPDANVPASSFSSMNWVPASWGAQAVTAAGLGRKDQLREAIQLISGEVALRRVFTHTGWRMTDSGPVYLHAGGAIGATGIEVELEDALRHYILPMNPEGLKLAMQASLEFLEVAPLVVSIPLWATIWLALLTEILGPDFVPWLYGPTGNLKSTLAALIQAHFGPFNRLNLPASFQDTRNYLEKLSFLAKDTVLVVDDFHPAASKEMARDIEQTALRLVRGQGNRQGRGRMRPDTSIRPAYTPRGMVIVTGEQLLSGYSAVARTFVVDIDRQEIDLDKLSECQRNAHLFPHATAGYLNWVRENWDEFKSTLPREWLNLRQVGQAAGLHLRLPEVVAYLALGLECGLQFAEEIGAIDVHYGESLRAEGWGALLQLADMQGARVSEERPTVLFMDTLRELLSQKKIHLKGTYGEEPPDPYELGWIEINYEGGTRWVPNKGADCVGWADDNFLYLMPKDTYRRVARFATESASYFPVKQNTLLKQLAQEELIVKNDEGRNTVVEWLDGSSKRVLKMRREILNIQPIPEKSIPDGNSVTIPKIALLQKIGNNGNEGKEADD